MAIVSIGPHLIKNGMSGLVAPGFEHTGYSIELAGDEFSLNVSVYRSIFHHQPDHIHFRDFYVSADEITFRLLPTAKIQQQSTAAGELVSLEALLCSLYIRHGIQRPITSFLAEVRKDLPVNHCYYPRIKDGSKMVTLFLAELGFEVTRFASYGRTLAVQFGWVFPQDRQNREAKLNEYAGTIDFKPRPDRTLGKGKWNYPRESSLAYLFTDMLESGGKKGLLSKIGIKAAIEHFKWTRVSLLTNQEAKQARIDFVREHPELHHNYHALAKALKAAELYSGTAEIYAIKKQVPKMIEAATGR